MCKNISYVLGNHFCLHLLLELTNQLADKITV